MAKLIEPSQVAFLTNRNIAENVFLAQEVVHAFAGTKKKNGFLGLKLDFQRAYDRMEWPFLVQVLDNHDPNLRKLTNEMAFKINQFFPLCLKN